MIKPTNQNSKEKLDYPLENLITIKLPIGKKAKLDLHLTQYIKTNLNKFKN